MTARVFFDGSNGVAVSRRTRIRDHERAPAAADLKTRCAEEGKDRREDFRTKPQTQRKHVIGTCWVVQIEVGGDEFINKVGTFSVASGSYYWSRAATAIGRLAQYIPG